MNARSTGGVIANREEAGVVLSCSLVRHALGGGHPVANAHVIPAYAGIHSLVLVYEMLMARSS